MELYGPPPSQGNGNKNSSASLANEDALEKAPGAAEEPPAHKNHPASRQSSSPDCHGHNQHHPERQDSNQRIAQTEARDGTGTSNEGPSILPSAMHAVEKVDKDHEKAAHTTEEGELSMDSQECHSLEPDSLKRKEHRRHDDSSERDLKRLRS